MECMRTRKRKATTSATPRAVARATLRATARVVALIGPPCICARSCPCNCPGDVIIKKYIIELKSFSGHFYDQ